MPSRALTSSVSGSPKMAYKSTSDHLRTRGEGANKMFDVVISGSHFPSLSAAESLRLEACVSPP